MASTRRSIKISEHKNFMNARIKPVLSLCLKLVADAKPNDPIKFVALQLRRFTIDELGNITSLDGETVTDNQLVNGESVMRRAGNFAAPDRLRRVQLRVPGQTGESDTVRAENFYLEQDYTDIKAAHAGSGKLFEDSEFPATDQTIGSLDFLSRLAESKGSSSLKIEWKRPSEITGEAPNLPPSFLLEEETQGGTQGAETDSKWLNACIKLLRSNSILLRNVVPLNQNFNYSDDYCGLFHFRFWNFGEWVNIIIDDRLPTVDGKLIIASRSDDFWVPLLVKAYAKLNGSYEAIFEGSAAVILEDFTGGIAVQYSEKVPDHLFSTMQLAKRHNSILFCSFQGSTNNTARPNGLAQNQTYGVVSVKQFNSELQKDSIQLLRLKPLRPAEKTLWNGAWSASSPLWNILTQKERQFLELSDVDDDEIWMGFEDFTANLETCVLCHVAALQDTDLSETQTFWRFETISGEWTKETAGGSPEYSTFSANPYYLLSVPKLNEDANTFVCIGLMQIDRRRLRLASEDEHEIGFIMQQIDDNLQMSELQDFLDRVLPQKSYNLKFQRARESVLSEKLPPGRYVIIPSTSEPGFTGQFLIRLLTEVKAT